VNFVETINVHNYESCHEVVQMCQGQYSQKPDGYKSHFPADVFKTVTLRTLRPSESLQFVQHEKCVLWNPETKKAPENRDSWSQQPHRKK